MNIFDINKNYTELLSDDIPILYIGFNQQNRVIIGSLINELEGNNVLYFRSIISCSIAANFINQKISYLDVLKNAEEIFIVNEDYNQNTISFVGTAFSEIHESILPLPSGYCPDIDPEVKTTLIANLFSYMAFEYYADLNKNKGKRYIFISITKDIFFVKEYSVEKYQQGSVYNIEDFRIEPSHNQLFKSNKEAKYLPEYA